MTKKLMSDTYKFFTKPYAHQDDAFLLTCDEAYYAIFGDPGTGKSKVLVDTIAYLYKRNLINAALIIAPKGMYHQWYDREAGEFAKHCPRDVFNRSFLYRWSPGDTLVQKKAKAIVMGLTNEDYGLRVCVMNVEAFSTPKGKAFALKFVKHNKVLVAVDESNTIANSHAKRTRAITSVGGLAPYRRILTGTPVSNGPLDVFSQMGFLHQRILGPSLVAFRSRYCELEDTYVGRDRVIKTITGYKRLDELQRRIAPFSVRFRKEDCLDLPPKVYQRCEVELDEAQRNVYNALVDKALVDLQPHLAGQMSVKNALGRLLRLHQVCSGFVTADPKYMYGPEDFTLEPGEIEYAAPKKLAVISEARTNALMDAVNETDGKVVIWVVYKPDAQRIVARLTRKYGKYTAAPYTGDQSDPEYRKEMVKAFLDNKNPLRFFVATQATGRFGLNLVKPGTPCHTGIFYQNGWSYMTRVQAEDRQHRIGQDARCVTYIDLVAPGTLEEKILKVLQEKDTVARAITGDAASNWLQHVRKGGD